MAAILFESALLRFAGINWDNGHHLHPDERFITSVTNDIRLPSLDHYFDIQSPLNPNALRNASYVYGTLPVFVARVAGDVLQPVMTRLIPPDTTNDGLRRLLAIGRYDGVYLLGRALSAIYDLLTILLIFFIARRLYSTPVALLACVLAGLTALQIQASHYFTVETALTLLVTVAIYFAIRAAESGTIFDWAMLGIATGLGAASKVTALMLAVIFIAAAGILWYRATQLDAYKDRRRFLWEDIVTGLFVATGLAFLAFRFTQPYAFAGPGIFDIRPDPRWVEVFTGFQRIGTGDADVPFNHSWAGATPYLWQLREMTLWGMGPPFAIAAWVGTLLATLHVLRNPRQNHMLLLPLLWVVVNFAYWGIQFTKLLRYLLPIYPFLTIFAAALLVSLWGWGRARRVRRFVGAEAHAVPMAAATEWRVEVQEGTFPPRRMSRSRGFSQVPSIALRSFVVLAVGWTAFYALAFTSVYTRPHPRIEASAWMYDRIPAGSKLGTEHWDDRLPLGLPGKDGGQFRYVDFNNYDGDTVEKRNQLIDKLDETDYIVLSSNRLYGSIPKLPQRYPLTTRYYDALFAGDLGFQKVAVFGSRPTFLGVELDDDDAEESFTVYDHPRVTVFQKADTYSRARVRSVLEAVSLDSVVSGLRPKFAGTNGLLLDAEARDATRTGGTWSELFDRDSLANSLPLVSWYLAVQMLGLLALPLTWFVCRRLGDGGYALSKTIAILAIAYVPWLLASLRLMPYTRTSILLGIGLLVLASAIVLGFTRSSFAAYLRAQWRTIAAVEALFAVVFLSFTALRAANPDLWHSAYGGEKPMDFAYLNAIMKTTWFPPYDPWLAGGFINYYYFGFVIVGSLIKLTGIVPWVAYNLAIPTIAALTAVNVACVVYNLLLARTTAPGVRRVWAFAGGVLGAFLAIVAGNLHGIIQVADRLIKLDSSGGDSSLPIIDGAIKIIRGAWILVTSFGQGLPPWTFDFWAPTRVIAQEGEITEFPFFTFLYGDLHAHMIAMPLGMLVVALALNLVRQPDWIPALRGRSLGEALGITLRAALSPGGLTLGLAALAISAARMTNSWDYPTYLGLIASALLLVEVTRRPGAWAAGATRSAVLAAVVVIASEAFARPYTANYALFYSGVERATAQTALWHYVVIMGAFLAAMAVYLGFQLSSLRRPLASAALGALGTVGAGPTAMGVVAAAPTLPYRVAAPHRFAVALATAVAFLAGLMLLSNLPVVGVAILGIDVLAFVALLRRPSKGTLFVFLLTATALAISAGVDLFVLTGAGRMNTVFKFYLQAWFFLAIASAFVLTLMARRAWGSPWLLRGGRRTLAGFTVAVIAITFIYPLLATPSKLQHRFVHLPWTLDGMAFMEVGQYKNHDGTDVLMKDDFPAINWMLDHVQGTPVIVEGLGDLYRWTSRVSIYTGLPTVRGWDWHQKQQRGDFAFMVDDRTRDVETIFKSPSPDAVRPLLDKYKVEYVYVGGQERALYPAEGLAKFERMVGPGFERVYQGGAVTIYGISRS